jgi:hypothetical protein
MLIEMLICMIHAPPFFTKKFLVSQGHEEIEYTLDMFCSILILFRFYMVLQYFAKYSTWTNNERSEKICRESHCEGGLSFAIKCELKERPYHIIMVAIGISIFIFGYAMRAAEL